MLFCFISDMYTFLVAENAAVGTTVGRISAEDGDTGINARMTYSLEDDLEKSSTFIIKTDPETQEGVIVLAKVNTPSICLVCFYFRPTLIVIILQGQR